jgi:HTH-type transcriptional regulator/antitoxin HigA
MAEGTPKTPEIQPNHPGKMLRQMLDAKGWGGDELAEVTGFARTHLSSVMSGKMGISPDMAVALAAAFGNTPAEWLRWNAEHQLSLVSVDPAEVEARAAFYDLAPIRDMQKRGWIKETRDFAELDAELTRFFGGSIREGVTFPVATLKSDPLTALNPAEKAWCFRARQGAVRSAHVAEFDPERLEAAQKKLRQLAAYPKEIERLPETLAYYGIRFVIVELIPEAKMDGAAFWIGDSPAIAISARWDRIDAIWFTIMHEFMHIKNGDAYSFDANLVRDSDHGIAIATSDDAAEQRANEQASDALVPAGELDSFIKRQSPRYAAERIIQFANRIKMHPGVIVGQLQHRRELKYSAHRDFLVKVRNIVAGVSLTDGWGQTIGTN